MSSPTGDTDEEKRRAALKFKCENDLEFLATKILGQTVWQKGLHDELAEILNSPEPNKLLLVPRGHFKSTIGTVIWTVQQILKDHNIRILITNAIYDQAAEFLGQIIGFLRNPVLVELYGNFEGPGSRITQETITIAQKKDITRRGPSVRIAGLGSTLTGSHPDIMIHDDLVTDANVSTSEQIQKVIRFYESSLDLLNPGGTVVVIGTRYAEGDLYGKLIHEAETINGILVDEARREKWRDVLRESQVKRDANGHRTYKVQHGRGSGMQVYLRQAIENSRIIFPGVKGVYGFVESCKDHKIGDKAKCLQCLRAKKSPHSFRAQYFNDPIAAEVIEFKPEWVRKFEYSDELVQKLARTKGILSIDPATRLKETNDYTGICVTKIPDDKMIYVLEAIRRRMSPEQLIAETFRLVEVYNVQRVLIETTSAQILFLSLFREEMIRRKKFFTIEEVKQSTKETKAMRIRGMIPHYANGRVLHRSGLDHLEDELIQFPRNTHDDLIDALSHQREFWRGVPLSSVQKRDDAPYGSLNWWKKPSRSNDDKIKKLFGDLLR